MHSLYLIAPLQPTSRL